MSKQALLNSIVRRDTENVQRLISEGVRIDLVLEYIEPFDDYELQYPLDESQVMAHIAFNNQEKMAMILIRSGMNVIEKSEGYGLLKYCVQYNFSTVLNYIIVTQNVTCSKLLGELLLFNISSCDSWEHDFTAVNPVISTLITHGADLNIMNNMNENATDYLYMNMMLPTLQLFISEKAFFTQHTSWLINVWIDRFSEKDRTRLDMIWTASDKSDFSGIETRSIEIMLKKDINVDFSKIGNDVIQTLQSGDEIIPKMTKKYYQFSQDAIGPKLGMAIAKSTKDTRLPDEMFKELMECACKPSRLEQIGII